MPLHSFLEYHGVTHVHDASEDYIYGWSLESWLLQPAILDPSPVSSPFIETVGAFGRRSGMYSTWNRLGYLTFTPTVQSMSHFITI